ncbi:uncharacterized protein METZ01_LOCUS392526 [marine metagenome]|uniref:Uncharacterized protein n=1 Tax=marine metagenome TaxID=408172 RepID=A0A382UZI6_9ZZZZ
MTERSNYGHGTFSWIDCATTPRRRYQTVPPRPLWLDRGSDRAFSNPQILVSLGSSMIGHGPPFSVRF